MGNGCKDEIHTLHAPLIHKARDVEFQIAYDNNGTPASIICIDQKNVQFALEAYWSQAGIPKHNIIPTGIKNRVNLVYTVVEEFIPGTLEVYLSGDKLNGDQTDVDRDYNEAGNFKGFTLLIDASKPHRLNAPPFQDESLYVNYVKRITFDTKGGT